MHAFGLAHACDQEILYMIYIFIQANLIQWQTVIAVHPPE